MISTLSACKPRVIASLRPGYIRISCEKDACTAVRVQTREWGGEWRTLIDEWNDFPVDDYTPVTVPGHEEGREYRAIPVAYGEEIGEPSEIVSVTVPG